MSPEAPAPCLSHLVDTPAPPYGSPVSCPRISASSRLTSLCFWPPLCCQILFSHITPRHRTLPLFNYPKKSSRTECLILWVLLRIGGKKKCVMKRVRSCSIQLLLLPFLVQNNEQIKPAQAPWASSNCSDLVGYHLCPSLAAITKCHGLRVGSL